MGLRIKKANGERGNMVVNIFGVAKANEVFIVWHVE